MAAGRKTSLIRDVNDRIDIVLLRFGADETAHFFCECPSALCGRRIPLTAAEFESIRARGELVLAPGCAASLRFGLSAV